MLDGVHNRSLLVSFTLIITRRLLNEFCFGLPNTVTALAFQHRAAAAGPDGSGVNLL